ncbi:Kinesin-like protein kif21b [Puccinia graminis f. sp. tritici]|uniref:Kinesin-like protein kif21b n=1 Tax=Puccinia graminis f. sp. tritici TaxID=56615 RepID=A0A5B0S822_PUCGR|nr:Kinesin-like protein kif21b [Puccinia graminis f. sp. tritici]
MKHELSKIKALKAIVSKGASSHSSTPASLNDDDEDSLSRSRLHGPFSRPIKIDSQLVNILKSHFAIQLPSATGSSSGLSKPTSSAVMIQRNSRIVSSYLNLLTHSIASSISTSSNNNNSSSTAISANPSTESEGQGGTTTMVDDLFLLFLVNLNVFFCNSVSPPPSATHHDHPSSSSLAAVPSTLSASGNPTLAPLPTSDPPRTNSDQKTSIPQLGFTAVSSPCYRLESFTLWNLPTLSVRITKYLQVARTYLTFPIVRFYLVRTLRLRPLIGEVKTSKRVIPNSPIDSKSPSSSDLSSIPSEAEKDFDSLDNQSLAHPKEGNLISSNCWTPIATSSTSGTRKQTKRKSHREAKPPRFPEWTPEISTYLSKKSNKKPSAKKKPATTARSKRKATPRQTPTQTSTEI